MDQTNSTTQSEISIDEAVATLVGGLPKAVRDFVVGPRRNEVVLALMRKYKMHADQAGGFEHAFLFMLLGITTPEEFMDELRKEGFDEQTTQGVINDINEQVFKKIQATEQKSREEILPAARPAPAQKAAGQKWVPVVPPAPIASTPTPVPVAAPTPQTFVAQAPNNIVLPGSTPMQPAPQQAAPAPQVMQPAPSVHIYMQQQPAPAPQNEPAATFGTMRTMAEDMKAIKAGEHPAPHMITLPESHGAPHAQPVAPTPVQTPQPQQTWTPPTPPKPVAPPQQFARPYMPSEISRRPAASPPPRVGNNDPYREPVE
ncbi:MAG: VgrG protein [Parcubacteria bacterium C7867-001]|nr:MAG: VgrG protein [Parcubacteria bacterium C7867-001]